MFLMYFIIFIMVIIKGQISQESKSKSVEVF